MGFVILCPLSQETWLPLDQNKSKHRGPILQKSLPSLSQNHEASPKMNLEITKPSSRIAWGGSFLSKPSRLTISWWLGFVILGPPSQEIWLSLDQNKSEHRGPNLQKPLSSPRQNHGAQRRKNSKKTPEPQKHRNAPSWHVFDKFSGHFLKASKFGFSGALQKQSAARTLPRPKPWSPAARNLWNGPRGTQAPKS